MIRLGLLSIFSGILFSACHTGDGLVQNLKSPLPHDGAGVAFIKITPLGEFNADLEFDILGGSPHLHVECNHTIYDYTDPDVLVLSDSIVSTTLDIDGNASVRIHNVLCSRGAETAFISWACRAAAFPYSEAPAESPGGNTVFFKCPTP